MPNRLLRQQETPRGALRMARFKRPDEPQALQGNQARRQAVQGLAMARYGVSVGAASRRRSCYD
jgi:hypothetical protein